MYKRLTTLLSGSLSLRAPTGRSNLVIAIISLLFLVLAPVCLAAFDLTALPADGGFDLRFGRISAQDFKTRRDITIRVNSDGGRPYRVIQKVLQPLSNTEGAQLADQQFKMWTVVNSNTRGTLVRREEKPLTGVDTILYASDATGGSDAFQVSFSLTPKESQTPGSYYGRIAFVLEPMDSAQSQVVVSLNIYAELTGEEVPLLEVALNSGDKRLHLSSKTMDGDYPRVYVRVNGPAGSVYRVYQNIEGGRMYSESAEDLDLSRILFNLEGAKNGSMTAEGNMVRAGSRQLLFVSDAHGSPDEWRITYKPQKELRMQGPGLYRGRLSFSLESAGAPAGRAGAFETLDFEIDIAPLFEIKVFSQEKEGVNLNFGQVSFSSGPKTAEVEIVVESNLRRAYQVIQQVSGPMMNEERQKLPRQDFKLKVQPIEETGISPGRYALKDPVVVEEGQTVVFRSGSLGESAHFKIEYELALRPEARAGTYSTRIGYSLALI